MPDYNYNYFKYIYHIVHPKLKSSAQLMPCSSGYYTVHLTLAKSLIPNESKISSHKCIGLLNSIVEYLVVDIIEFLFLKILLQKCI